MKTIPVFIVLSIARVYVMIVVDFFLGARAEFLNAWNVVERLLGHSPSAGDSAVYRSLGAAGEFLCVGLVNTAIGGVLTVFVKFLAKK